VDFDLAFGKSKIFQCTIPKNAVIVSFRAVIKLGDIPAFPKGAWSDYIKLEAINKPYDISTARLQREYRRKL
jgi:hypothetical protein